MAEGIAGRSMNSKSKRFDLRGNKRGVLNPFTLWGCFDDDMAKDLIRFLIKDTQFQLDDD